MAKKSSKQKSPQKLAAPIESIRHKDKRKNIPTEELAGFMADEELAPKKVLYPRDASLDPQLVWRGKDDQDRADLAVPVVPIYIQEKIHPQAIIDDFRRNLPSPSGRGAGGEGSQLDLFADFNGLPEEFDQRVDFYHHEGHWSNRMILGDSLLVMTSLSEKEGLKGKVQCIYLDPPYGIKFGSNWQVSTRKRDVKDGKAEDATRQPEQIRAFRDTWELGIHSYLAYLRDRLVAARELLTETGSVFVQIGDENVHLVRCIMDEVFGSENFASLITFRTTTNLVGNYLGKNSDYILWFAKGLPHLKYRQSYIERGYDDDVGGRYSRVELRDGTRRVMTTEERADPSVLPNGSRIYRHDNLTSQGATASGTVPFTFKGQTFLPSGARHWTTAIEGMQRLAVAERLAAPTANSLAFIRYLDDFTLGERTGVWIDTQTGAFTDDKVYVVQTNTKVIERCLLMTTDPGDLVLDPTCGSGTTAYVAEQWGRRWITCDTSRVALALARTRLMAGKFPYYLLADSAAGRKKEAEVTGTPTAAGRPLPGPLPEGEGDIRQGFVYKRVPHVTLKSIANNPNIKEGMTRKEIDAAIAKHAESETLYDQPYEDKKTVRVSGPFTVESLSPHRTISVEEKIERATVGRDGLKMKIIGPDNFATMILDNLKKAGVQNTIKGERLKFDSLEPFAGEWIHAEGWYTEKAKSAGTSPLPDPLPEGEGDIKKPLPEGAGSDAPRGGLHRPGAWHGRGETHQRGGQGSGSRGRLRRAPDLRLCLRPQRFRRGQALRQADGAAGADEPRSCDGRRALEEDRRREFVHGIWRAGCGDSPSPLSFRERGRG